MAARTFVLWVALVPLIAHVTSADVRGAEGASAVGLRAASAAINLEADDSMVTAGGIGPGRVQGQEGQLRATAVVVRQSGATPVAMVACDVVIVPGDIVDGALKEIETAIGLPPSNVLVSATHTHAAPSVSRVHDYDRDPVFAKRLQQGIVDAVKSAYAKLNDEESEFLFCMGEENTVGSNSRQRLSDGMIYWVGPKTNFVGPTGPFDPQLPVLAFRGKSGRWQAVIYNHSTHNIGTRNGNVRSPSFYGLAAQELEPELNANVCFFEGAAGSTHNIKGVTAADATDRMKQAVRDALQRATVHPVKRVASIKRPFTYHVRKFDEAVEDDKVVTYCRKYFPDGCEIIARVFRKMRQELAPHQGEQRTTRLQAIVIGDVAIAAVPGEYFTGLGMDIKRRSPFTNTMVVELANDSIGYLPDREAYDLGGYQTWMGLHSFVEPGTGERVADEMITMLHELRGQND